MTGLAYGVGWLLAWGYLSTRSVVSINAFAVPLQVTNRAIVAGVVVSLVLAWFAGRLAARRYVRADIVTLVGR